MKKVIGYILFGTLFFFSGLLRPVFSAGFTMTWCNPPINTQLRTAIGCVDASPAGLIQKLLAVSLGIAGGVALLMIILGAMQIQMSAGDPERVNGGREIVEGAITGVLLIIFAIFILRVVGVDILGIPGFH